MHCLEDSLLAPNLCLRLGYNPPPRIPVTNRTILPRKLTAWTWKWRFGRWVSLSKAWLFRFHVSFRGRIYIYNTDYSFRFEDPGPKPPFTAWNCGWGVDPRYDWRSLSLSISEEESDVQKWPTFSLNTSLTFMLHVVYTSRPGVCQKVGKFIELRHPWYSTFSFEGGIQPTSPEKKISTCTPLINLRNGPCFKTMDLFRDVKRWLVMVGPHFFSGPFLGDFPPRPAPEGPKIPIKRPARAILRKTFGRGGVGGLDGWRFRRSRFFMIFRA